MLTPRQPSGKLGCWLTELIALADDNMITEPVTFIGPDANGVAMTPEEFDGISDWDPAYRYELIRGTVVVSPIPSEGEAGPNDELGHWLRNHQYDHPQGHHIDQTLPGRYIYFPDGSRRRADRVVWVGLGRRPEPKQDVPAIVIEFVSPSKRDWLRDYVEKRDEYREVGVREYWVIDRFRRQMTVFTSTDESHSARRTLVAPICCPASSCRWPSCSGRPTPGALTDHD
jgi:Uma2 family endonuclease